MGSPINSPLTGSSLTSTARNSGVTTGTHRTPCAWRGGYTLPSTGTLIVLAISFLATSIRRRVRFSSGSTHPESSVTRRLEGMDSRTILATMSPVEGSIRTNVGLLSPWVPTAQREPAPNAVGSPRLGRTLEIRPELASPRQGHSSQGPLLDLVGTCPITESSTATRFFSVCVRSTRFTTSFVIRSICKRRAEGSAWSGPRLTQIPAPAAAMARGERPTGIEVARNFSSAPVGPWGRVSLVGGMNACHSQERVPALMTGPSETAVRVSNPPDFSLTVVSSER